MSLWTLNVSPLTPRVIFYRLFVFRSIYLLSWSLRDSLLTYTHTHTGTPLYCALETTGKAIQVWRWICRWSQNKGELSSEKLAVFTKPQGMASTRWNLSDLFGVLTLPYGFRQNWNAKQNSKSFKAVNGNCQVLKSGLWGSEREERYPTARKWSHSL